MLDHIAILTMSAFQGENTARGEQRSEMVKYLRERRRVGRQSELNPLKVGGNLAKVIL